MRRTSPRMDPPEGPPECCLECGSTETTDASYREGLPFCEEHDSEIRRERIRIERRLSDVGERRAHVHMDLSPHRSEDERERARGRMERLNQKAAGLNSRIEELREECDHDRMKADRREVTGEMFTHEAPDKVPYVEVFRSCPDCRYSETTEEP